jgi:hypothetical protein
MQDYTEEMTKKMTAKLKVVICVPTRVKPSRPFIESLEKSIPLIVGAGYDEALTQEVGNPYISGARASMLKRGLRANGDIFLFLDDDLSWDPSFKTRTARSPQCVRTVVSSAHAFRLAFSKSPRRALISS